MNYRRTLGDWLFAVTAADAHTVDNISLLGLVTETAGLVRAGWARGAVDDVQLSVFPAPVKLFQSSWSFAKSLETSYRTRRRNRRTSDCFFLYNSPIYLYAPILHLDHVSPLSMRNDDLDNHRTCLDVVQNAPLNGNHPSLRKVCTATTQLWQFPSTVQFGPTDPLWALNETVYFRVPNLYHAVPMKRHQAEINKTKQIAIIHFPRRSSASVHVSTPSTSAGGSSKGCVSEVQISQASQPPESRQEPPVVSWRWDLGKL